jgi:putative serine/threonine protein kinase
MRKLGVEAIEFQGSLKMFDKMVLGKGSVGIVVLVHIGNRKEVIKIRRTDANRVNMNHEADMLGRANLVNVGPRLLGSSQNLVLMEYIDGSPFPAWLESQEDKKILVVLSRVLRDLLEQSWRLDRIGLDHGELRYASKHILMKPHGEACILDFESASLERRSSNVTSISHYLFLGNAVSDKVKCILGDIDVEKLVEALKCYKRDYSRESFDSIMRVCDTS